MGSVDVLKVQNVCKSFGKKKVLKGITIDIEQGEILALIGSSGSGKTTLLKTLIGFNVPDEGDVKFRDNTITIKSKGISIHKDTSIYAMGEHAKSIFGFASQEPSFYENLTVKENLTYFGSLYGLPSHALHSNVDILLALMDLKEAESTLGSKLSGGMQRRLDIACALIHDPDILILDEPTSDLDPALRTHICNLIRKINRKGTTIIISSHHLSEVESLCSRIAILKNGTLIDVDTPHKLKSKYSGSQDIFIHTYPGDYPGIFQKVKKAHPAATLKSSADGVVIRSKNTRAAIIAILDAIDSLDEELVDIKVSRPGLDELFLKLTKSEQ